MREEITQRALQLYGLAAVRQLAVQKGYRNESHAAVLADGRRVNLVLYKQEPGILAKVKNANRVADFLAETSPLPVRRTADRRILVLKAGTATKYGALYAYLPGNTIPWEGYTMEHLKLLGGAMGTMHAHLHGLPRGTLPAVASEYLAIWRRMQRYFSQAGVQRALQKKLQLTIALPDYAPLLHACAKLPGQQALHMDFVRGNILFQSRPATHISGILDFEKTAWGHPVFDIARTLAFLLVDCKYKDGAKMRKYFLHSGYQKRGHGQLAVATADTLEQLITLFLIYDLYKFLRHNPYEFLEQNEHFVRTRNIVANRVPATFDRIPTGNKGSTTGWLLQNR